MSEFKVGDKVVLRPETKPYTFRSDHDDEIKIEELDYYVYQEFTYIVKEVLDDGDVLISHDGYNKGYIAPWHLKHAKEDTKFEDFHKEQFRQYSEELAVLESDMKERLYRLEPTIKLKGVFDDFQSREILSHNIDTTELRLSIFNAKPNRTLEEMQAIENWLLGEK